MRSRRAMPLRALFAAAVCALLARPLFVLSAETTSAAPAPASQTDSGVIAGTALRQIEALPREQQSEALRTLQDEAKKFAQRTRDPILRLFNMTSWIELPWFLLGVAGQLAFFLRMFAQWIASERKKQSVVPPVFWWLSLGGSGLLVTYGFWRQDVVIIFGQLLGVFIYARNLWFIKQARERGTDAPAAAPLVGRGVESEKPPEVIVTPAAAMAGSGSSSP